MTLFAYVMLAFLPLATSPEAEGVSSRRLLEWIDVCERDIDCLHGFVFLRHGKVIAEGSWKPYDTLNETHFLSSHSKCFITTAVGILADEGKLDLDERIVDIVPDLLPAKPSANLAYVRVRDLLTMNFGATNGERWSKDVDGDWIKAILASDIDRKPGQAYRYDSGATHLLGFIVARRSGKPLMDFLRERLFSRIGIEKAWTSYDPKGNPCAAWGFNMTTREIATIGQLHLNKGVWNGQRILSEKWVDLATAKQTWSGKTPTEFQPKNDWLYGFGFNWWHCQHGFYRADGSGGQYTIVFPKYDAVLSIHADVGDMQKVLDVVWDRFLPVFGPDALPADPAAAASLKERCANLELKPVAGRREGVDAALCGKNFAFKEPVGRIRGVRLEQTKDGWMLRMMTDAGTYDVPVGYGKWARSEMKFSAKRHEALGDIVGVRRVATSAAVQKDGSLKLRMYLLEGTHKMDLTFRRKLFRPVVEGRMEGLGEFASSLL